MRTACATTGRVYRTTPGRFLFAAIKRVEGGVIRPLDPNRADDWEWFAAQLQRPRLT